MAKFDIVAGEAHPAGAQSVQMILNEAGYAAREGAACLREALETCPGPPTTGYTMVAGHKALDLTCRGLAYAATVSRCVRATPRSGANRKEVEFHRERSRRVSAHLDGIDLSVLHDREVRNSLEHVDEHVDRLCMRRSDNLPRPTIIQNMAFSSRGAFEGDILYCRTLFGAEGVFSNLGHEVELQPILAVLEQVRNRLQNEGGMIFN